jgi:nucleoside-diphosphate-sugar epimerase
MVHVHDVISAALLAAEHPKAKGQVYIAADNEPFSTRQLYEWISEAAGRTVPGWTVPLPVLKLLGRVGDGIGKLRGRRFLFDSDALAKLTGNAWYSSAKLQRELGWVPKHTLRETLPKIEASAGRSSVGSPNS